MKLFVVFDSRSEPYESQSIWGVFDTREKAEAFVKECHYKFYSPNEVIEEFELNKPSELYELNKPR